MSSIVLLVLRLFPLGSKYLLILDRTNWKWGKTPINILMLSVAYLGISIPLFWVVLDLEGNSSPEDRISMLKRVLEKFGLEKIEALLADHEFIGKKWFGFLCENKIPFVIRIKRNFKAGVIQGEQTVPVGKLCKIFGSRKILNQPINLWGYPLYISIQRTKKAKESLIVVSNFVFKDALKMYKKRWGIETLFGCLKSRGFRMEDTHMTDADKIEKLLFVLAIAFCWAYRTGDIQAKKEPIEIKTHGRKAKSLFRIGLDFIRRVFLNLRFLEFKRLLECFERLESMGRAL